MRLSLSVKILVICLISLFVLAACSGSPIPEISQTLPPQGVQQGESEPAPVVPTETFQVIPATPEAINPEPIEESAGVSDLDGSSPAIENQSPNDSYPPPEDSIGGYPAPGEILPTPTIRSAYPAPENESDLVPNPPPVKTGLEATDPSTVILASGELQFVEFFAFW